MMQASLFMAMDEHQVRGTSGRGKARRSSGVNTPSRRWTVNVHIRQRYRLQAAEVRQTSSREACQGGHGERRQQEVCVWPPWGTAWSRRDLGTSTCTERWKNRDTAKHSLWNSQHAPRSLSLLRDVGAMGVGMTTLVFPEECFPGDVIPWRCDPRHGEARCDGGESKHQFHRTIIWSLSICSKALIILGHQKR